MQPPENTYATDMSTIYRISKPNQQKRFLEPICHPNKLIQAALKLIPRTGAPFFFAAHQHITEQPLQWHLPESIIPPQNTAINTGLENFLKLLLFTCTLVQGNKHGPINSQLIQDLLVLIEPQLPPEIAQSEKIIYYFEQILQRATLSQIVSLV